MTAKAPPGPVKCARPGCTTLFTPRHASRKYCSGKCKSTVQAYKFALNGGR